MATAKVLAHSFKMKHADPTKEGPCEIDSPPTLILAKCGGEEVRVSVPVTRGTRPDVGAEVEITEPVRQVKPLFNKNGVPSGSVEIYSANLLTKTTAALTKRDKVSAQVVRQAAR